MAENMDIHVVNMMVGAIGATGTVPVMYVPPQGGDITVLDAQITGNAAGTPVGLKLISFTDANPPVNNGTIAQWGGTFAAGTITMGAGSVFEATILSPRVGAGYWLGLQNASGTTPAATWVNISYVYGV